ncbi:MAG: hypothetical protein MUP60_00035, partial [Candidatus Thorarchaeota archaeon]|nr:hypothetical protein [Candidatus Thorarchaeota archaeon]
SLTMVGSLEWFLKRIISSSHLTSSRDRLSRDWCPNLSPPLTKPIGALVWVSVYTTIHSTSTKRKEWQISGCSWLFIAKHLLRQG